MEPFTETAPTLPLLIIQPGVPAEPDSVVAPPPQTSPAAPAGPASAAMRQVWLAAADVEGRRWALDRADNDLHDSIQAAIVAGFEPDPVAAAAGLTVHEVRNTLYPDPSTSETSEATPGLTRT